MSRAEGMSLVFNGLEAKVNPMAHMSAPLKVKAYLQTVKGASTFIKYPTTIVRFVAEIFRYTGREETAIDIEKAIEGLFGSLPQGLFCVYWASCSASLAKRAFKIKKEGLQLKNGLELTRSALKWMSVSCIMVAPQLKGAKIALDLSMRCIRLYQAKTGWNIVRDGLCQNDVEPALRKHLEEEKRLHELSMAQSALSILPVALDILCAAHGLDGLPPIVRRTMKVATSTFSLARIIHQQNMSYQPLA